MINKIIFCLLIFAIPINGECQRRLFSNDKTQHVLGKLQMDSVCIVPPTVLWAKVDKDDAGRLLYSLFDANLQSPVELDSMENIVSKHYKRKIDNYFGVIPHYYLSSISSDDSEIISMEEKKLETIVKNENVTTIVISDALANVLLKYPAHQYLLTGITEYHYIRGKSSDMFVKKRCFLIDIKSKQVAFYDYRIWRRQGRDFRIVFKGISEEVKAIRRNYKEQR